MNSDHDIAKVDKERQEYSESASHPMKPRGWMMIGLVLFVLYAGMSITLRHGPIAPPTHYQPSPAVSSPPTADQTITGEWRLAIGISSFDDSKTVRLDLTAENTISGWLSSPHAPSLILRCQENKTSAYIYAGLQGKTEFGLYGEDLGVSMRGRYDRETPFTYLMGKSTDSESFFFPEAIHEIQYMMSHANLVLGFTPFNSNPVEARFNLTGLPEAIKPLRAACGW